LATGLSGDKYETLRGRKRAAGHQRFPGKSFSTLPWKHITAQRHFAFNNFQLIVAKDK
jgi:hypothetical protein